VNAEALMLSPRSAETGPRVENSSLRIAVFEPLSFPFQTDIPRNVYRQHKTSPIDVVVPLEFEHIFYYYDSK